MNNFANKRKRRIILWLVSVIVIIAVITGAGAIYVNDYYRADSNAITTFATSNTIFTETLDERTVVYAPEKAKTGFVFYPGGKVEYTAYEPLMKACADKGILCVLIEMPFNLAVLDMNAAEGIMSKYPEIENWYIGGHSLGGSMAASYLSKNVDEFEGLILLGSYSTADLSGTDLDVLSIYGSEDKVMNYEKYTDNKTNLPKDFTEVVIDGGCHAGFGMYGAQYGDGIPIISNQEQIRLTAEKISELVK
ncbi:MAG: alpha/beta hydrolase [Clostridia bacterium]|nr:alpha/beta hydrolase [Clostridia bacterium]